MPNVNSNENTLEFALSKKKTRVTPWEWLMNSVSFYKAILFLIDFIMAALGLVFGLWINGMDVSLAGNMIQTIVILPVSFVVISLFSTFNLYNYHFIFLFKNHLTNTIKAIFWGFLTIGLISSIYTRPDLLHENYQMFLVLIMMLAIVLLLLSRSFPKVQLHLVKALGIGLIVIGICNYFFPDTKLIVLENKEAFLLASLSTTFFIVASRLVIVHVIFNIWARRHFRRQIVIFGSDQEATNIADHIISVNAPFWIAGVVGYEKNCGLKAKFPKECLGNFNELPQIVEKNNVSELILTNDKIDKHTLIDLLDFCVDSRINVWFPPKLLKIIDSKLYIDNFCGLKMIRLCTQKNTWLFNKIKYGFDALFALPVFLIQLPFFLYIALAIKMNSTGPVFYLAKAVGKNGKYFNMYKFRSMNVDNRSNRHKDYVTKLIKGEITNDGYNGQPLKITDDPRVTSVGRILRKYSLDELPQMVNILKGEMSLVGPRPCLPYEYEIYKEWHKKRTIVRPGITGLWQVAGRSEVSFEDMILLDLYYIYNRTLLMDWNILVETIFVVLAKKGAY